MPQPWWWKPSELPEGDSVIATCVKPNCFGHRYLPRAYLIKKVGDIPLHRIEPRLRCIERPRLNRRGPPCGGAMTLDWAPAARKDAPGGVPDGT